MQKPLVPLMAALTAVILIGASCANTHQSPPVEFPPNAAPSEILDAQGRLITTIGEQNRESVALAAVAPVAQDAVVAIEDSRFFEHKGVDPQAIGRAVKANADAEGIAEGGSTITQQYVKNALLTADRTISRKIEEATLALALERNYSKEAILEQYLNTIYFGSGAYGIEAASQTLFGVPASEVQLHQAALLAATIQSPARYDPYNNPGNAQARRNLVLERMQEQELITAEEQLAAASEPLGVVDKAVTEANSRSAAPHFVEEVKQWLLKESDAIGDNQAERYANLLKGGLTITTTIDLDLQAQAEAAVAEVLPGQGTDSRTPDSGLVSIEPTNGFVRAMVGGHDFYGGHAYAKANLAKGEGRQTGSVFKPIVMATALSEGVPVSKTYPAPTSASFPIPGGTWNVKGGGIGAGNMEQCTIVSSNTCYANIILDPAVGSDRSIEMARRLGITDTELAAVPAAVLGANNATVQDMASVYGTFANNGIHVPPTYVTRVEATDGTLLYEHKHVQSKALEPEVARTINSILPKVIESPSGTGKSANFGRLAGGKTGSSQKNIDGWFTGYTPQLATAVWVGFAEPKSMRPPNTRITVFGGTYPAQIWKAFMSSALEGAPVLPLVTPIPPPTTTTAPSEAPSLLLKVPTREETEVDVPDTLNQSSAQATKALKDAGFRVKVKELPVSGGYNFDTVIAQAPKSGDRVRSGATVWIEVTEKDPATTTPVPDLRGLPAATAAQRLREIGYTVGSTPSQAPAGSTGADGSRIGVGQVWKITPSPGALSPDGEVRIEWSPRAAATTTTTSAKPTTTAVD